MQKSRTMASFDIKASIKAVKIQLNDNKNKDLERESSVKSQTGSLNRDLSNSRNHKKMSSINNRMYYN